MPKRDEDELVRLDRELEEVERPLKRAQEAALKKAVITSNKIKNMIAALNKRYNRLKALAVPLMRNLGYKLRDLKEQNLRAELRFNFGLKDDEKGAAQLDRLKACFGRKAEKWIKAEEVTITRYSWTEQGKAFLAESGAEDLFLLLDCLSAPDEHRVPAFYVVPIPRSGQTPEGAGEEGGESD